MKPAEFDLHRPERLDEAGALLAEYPDDSKVLAGGQSLVPLLNFRMARPDHLIDLEQIAQLGEVRVDSDHLSVGAMVRHSFAERSAAIARHCPLLSAAIPHIAHPAVRNRGTIGGSLAHADPAAELPAVARALDAELVVYSATYGYRVVGATDFFRSNLVTSMNTTEILTEVRIPPVPKNTGAAFREVGRRQGDFALVGVAVQLTTRNGLIDEARVCFTGVSDIPYRCDAAEFSLIGTEPGPETFAAAAASARADLDPADDLHASAGYRCDVGAALLEQALADAARDATGPPNDTDTVKGA